MGGAGCLLLLVAVGGIAYFGIWGLVALGAIDPGYFD